MFNAQFLGARVAALILRKPLLDELIGTGLALVATAWMWGYRVAWLYVDYPPSLDGTRMIPPKR